MLNGRMLTILAVLAGMTPAAHAQREFRLDEDDAWTAVAAPGPQTPAGQLAFAREALADGEYEKAERLATRWIDAHPQHVLLPQAYLLRADSMRMRGDLYESLFDYEYVARAYTGNEAFVTALERELEIAKTFAAGTKRKFLGMRLFDASDEAEELLIRVQERLGGSALAEEAGLALGDFYFSRREMEMAVTAYSLFIENYPRSQFASTARRRLIYAHLASFKGPQWDATGIYEARLLLESLKETEPSTAEKIGADAIIDRIDESDATKLLGTAAWYEQTGDVMAAEMTVRRLVRRYPTSEAAGQALDELPGLLESLPTSVRDGARASGAYPESVFGDPPKAEGDDTPEGGS